MEHIFPDNWAFLHMGLIFSITLALMLVVYVLGDSSTPPAGLGLFTVYFMAALMGWLAFTLQQVTDTPLVVDVPAVATILSTYILFCAAGQRTGSARGRIVLGLLCLSACLSVFFLPAAVMFALQITTAALFFSGTAILCTRRALAQSNIGDAIMAYAALLTVAALPVVLYRQFALADTTAAQAIAFGVHSCAYALLALGFLASVLIEYQQHLSHLATADPLTRLLNRRGLEEALHISLAQAARQRLVTSAIAVDIDHFRKANDSFGQDTGDHIIRTVASLIERTCRAGDVVARTGGEEFLLILPDTDLDAARVLAERIRHAIGERPLMVDQQRIAITVSLGVATAQGEVDIDTLSLEANRAMVLAQRGGRNRVASVDSRPVRLSSTGTGG